MRKKLVDNHVLCEQNCVIEQLMKTDYSLIDNIHNLDDEVLEWWLVTSFLADLLKDEGETIIDSYGGCHWWGRTCSGMAIYMDGVIKTICKRFE